MQRICCFVENTTNGLPYGFLAHQQVRFDTGFFAPNANPFRAPFLDLKPLNGDLLHAIVEFKDFGFVGMAFRRLVGHFWRCNNLLWGLLVPYCSEIPFRWSKDVPQLLGDFFLAPSGLKEGLNLIPLFKTD